MAKAPAKPMKASPKKGGAKTPPGKPPFPPKGGKPTKKSN